MGDSLTSTPTRGLLASDTPLEVERLQVARWREMSPAEKAGVVADLTDCVRELSLAGIRSRHPDATDEECRLRYALITLGPSLAYKVYPKAKALAGR